jgi:hypothetical protein
MDALVLVRGITIHWVWLSVPAPEVDRYAGLFDRALAEAALPAPAELVEARERVSTHPRSVEPAVTYADALYKVQLFAVLAAIASFVPALMPAPAAAPGATSKRPA